MSTDETGSQARPTLPAEQDERERILAEGVAMIASGSTYREAQTATGLSTSVLHRYYTRICSQGTEQQKEELDSRIVSRAILNADLAGEELSRRLTDSGQLEKMTARDLGTIYGINADKLALKRKWSKPEETASDGFLDKLAQGMSRIRKVTVELEDPAERAIDITPTK